MRVLVEQIVSLLCKQLKVASHLCYIVLITYVYALVEIPFVTLTSTGWNVTPTQLSIETSSYCPRFQPKTPREIKKKKKKVQ